jgi:hypothetical protein
MMRPFAGAVLLHDRARSRRAAGPVDFEAFGFPVHWLEEAAERQVGSL